MMNIKFNALKTSLLIFLLLLSIGTAFAEDVEAGPDPLYNSLFRTEKDWTGADGAYTLKLSENKVLWLYGDTFVGDIKDGRRCNWELVNNSIAVQEGIDPVTAKVKFYRGKDVEGKPSAFIIPPENKGWYWFYDGVRTKAGLYLFLMHIERTSETEVFGFRQVGSSIAFIKNPDDDPENWVITQKRIPFSGNGITGTDQWGCALFNDGKYTYIYGVREIKEGNENVKYMLIARTGSDDITDFEKWRFLSGDQWVSEAKKAESQLKDIPNEYSVSSLPDLKKFVLVYSERGFSKKILARFSPSPFGSWGEPICVYECPESNNEKGIFCYAGKAHPELTNNSGELIITYADNAFDFQRLIDDASLYWPIFVRVKLIFP